jgi:hypothetical protein
MNPKPDLSMHNLPAKLDPLNPKNQVPPLQVHIVGVGALDVRGLAKPVRLFRMGGRGNATLVPVMLHASAAAIDRIRATDSIPGILEYVHKIGINRVQAASTPTGEFTFIEVPS